MKRSLVMLVSSFLSLGTIATSFVAMPADAQVVVEVGPPDEFIATATPVYFEGRPAYWWGGRWYYRDGRRWGAYRDEPGFLRDYRAHREPARAYYGRGGGGFRRR